MVMGFISFFRPNVSPGRVWRGTASLPAGLQPGSQTSTVVSYRTSANRNVAPRDEPQHNAVMRVLALLLVSAGVAFGIYQYSLKKMPVSDLGTAPTQAISLTGVRGDLLQIAQAERSFTALNDHCASIDELISSNSLTMQRPERDGYTYTVQCSGGDFTAIASHPPALAGSPIRYPTLAIDQTMQVHEQN
jgi:hypothetical protein